MEGEPKALLGSAVFRQPVVSRGHKTTRFKSIHSFATSQTDGFSVLCGSFSKYGRTKQGLSLLLPLGGRYGALL